MCYSLPDPIPHKSEIQSQGQIFLYFQVLPFNPLEAAQKIIFSIPWMTFVSRAGLKGNLASVGQDVWPLGGCLYGICSKLSKALAKVWSGVQVTPLEIEGR